MTVFDGAHERLARSRRVTVLVDHLEALIPEGARVIDVGAGDGQITSALIERRPDLDVVAIDVLVRPGGAVRVVHFDGRTMPFEDQSADVVLFVDVLHHATDQFRLLSEAARVTRGSILIKDHLRQGFLAQQTLRFMDDVGNRRHGVDMTYDYLSPDEWTGLFDRAGLERVSEQRKLSLYSWYASWLFDRSLHFVAELRPCHPALENERSAAP